jgi:hypothetical protein
MPSDEWLAENGIVIGAVNAALARETVERFQIEKLPAFLFIHKGKMFRYPRSDDPYHWDQITEFLLGGFEKVGGHDVPPPKSELQKMWETFKGPAGRPLWYGLTFCFLLFIFYAVYIQPPTIKAKAS